MIMTTRTIVTVIGTTMDMIVEMMVMATDEMEAGMVDTINIDDDRNKTERCRKLVRNISRSSYVAREPYVVSGYLGTIIECPIC